MAIHKRSYESRGFLTPPLALSAAAVLAVGMIYLFTPPVRDAGAVMLLGDLVIALSRFGDIGFASLATALGLALAVLVVVGVVLAEIHRLDTFGVAVAIGIVAVGTSWLSGTSPAEGVARSIRSPSTLSLLSAAGVLIFAAAAVFAVHYAAKSATADSDRASSVALWAIPSGKEVRIGVQQPAGHRPIALQVVLREDGAIAAKWNISRLTSDRAWQSPSIELHGTGRVRVTARNGARVIADLVVAPRMRRGS